MSFSERNNWKPLPTIRTLKVKRNITTWRLFLDSAIMLLNTNRIGNSMYNRSPMPIIRRITDRQELPPLVWSSPGKRLDPYIRIRSGYLQMRAGEYRNQSWTSSYWRYCNQGRHGWTKRSVSPGTVTRSTYKVQSGRSSKSIHAPRSLYIISEREGRTQGTRKLDQ